METPPLAESSTLTFSVIIPTRDRPRSLATCLDAMALQDYDKSCFEVIVVDDGSVAPLDDVANAQRGGLEVRVLRQPNSGPASARNNGAEIARHSFLVFTDDDCLPDTTWLSAMARQLAYTPQAMLGGAVVNAAPENPYSAASQALISYLYEYFNADGARFFCSNNLAVAKAYFLELGGFDTHFPLAAGEDREFCDRWHFEQRPMHYVPAAIVHHAHHLDLRRFCWQHLRYGRAAAYYHEILAKRRLEPVAIEPARFYRDLLAYPFGRMSTLKALACLFLLLLSQTMNAGRYFHESRFRPWERAADPSQ
jgi:glycosyltransferase involved in cell wall biosynthesis